MFLERSSFCLDIKCSARFEKKYSNLSKVEVDEMLRFMGHVGTKVPPNNTVPGGVVFLVKFFLDVGSDVFLDVELFHCLCSTLYSILLHVLGHVGIFDHSFSLGHLQPKQNALISFTLAHAWRQALVPFQMTTPTG